MARSFASADRILGSSGVNPNAFSALTMSVWYRGTPSNTATYGTTISLGVGGGAVTGIYVKNSGKAAYFIGNTTTNKLDPGSITISANVWTHMAVTVIAGGTAQGYINGATDGASFTGPASFVNSAQVQMGSENSSGNPIVGNLAQGAVWNVALTAAEILALAKGALPSTIRPASLTQWWPLDGLQSPESDLSSHFNNGTLTGTALAPGPPVAPFTPRGQPILLPVEGISGARRFNGTSDVITLSAAAAAAVSATGFPITMACWFNTSSFAQNNTLMSANNAALTNYMALGCGSGTSNVYLSSHGATSMYASGTASTNTWNHAAGVLISASLNSGGQAVYLNGGNKVSAYTGTPTTPTGYNLANVGAINTGSLSGFTLGQIADAAVWNATLTDAEILALSKGARPNTIRPKSLIWYLPLSGLQSPEPDLSGNAYNGTLTGTIPAPGPPIMPFSPRWPQGLDVVAAPAFNPAWRVPFNQVVSGGVAT